MTDSGHRISYEGADVVEAVGGVEADWSVLDSGAGIIDAGWRRFFPATGDERREFLHGQTTANVEALTQGCGVPAATLTAQGRPLALFALYETGERIWIATTAAHSAATRAALSRFLVADDCEFGNEVEARCFSVEGPLAADVLAAAGATPVPGPGSWAYAQTAISGQPVLVFSRGDLRVPAYDVLVCDADGTAGDASPVARALEKAGAVQCGVAAHEVVRVESGTARYGVDVDERRIAIEARLEWMIHFAKGCYVGQEVVERAVSRGRINHELALLSLSGDAEPGACVDGAGPNDVVTSVVTSPRDGRLALAYLPAARSEPGAAIVLRSDANLTDAVVLPWPRARVLAGRTEAVRVP
jgi:folate-binding protein YgfZ